MSKKFIEDYLNNVRAVTREVDVGEISGFIDELTNAHDRASQIFIFGNGGSASTASHFACDINKGVDPKGAKRFRVICLNDNIPTMLAYANDMSYGDIFAGQLRNFLKKGDIVIGISASGESENVLRAIRYANKSGGRTFGICGYGGGRLKRLAQKAITIKSDDMQKVEDIHMMILHCAMQRLKRIR